MDPSMKQEKGSSAFRMLLILAVVFAGAIFIYQSWHSGRDKGVSKTRLSDLMGSVDTPPFTLKNIHGEEFSSSRLTGKPAVINFFTTWCPACLEEIPGFIEVYEKYKESGFELIGIVLNADAETLPAFIAARNINYRILLGNMETVRTYGGFSSVPTTFMIGKDGKIKNILRGYISKDVFETEVRKLLQ